MKNYLKKIIANILIHSGILGIIEKAKPTKKVTVLMFHKVNSKEFANQIIYLKKHYNFINENELKEFLYEKKPLKKNSVLITFDDGYVNNYNYAYPIMKKYGVPGTIFLVTGLVGTNKMAWYDEIEYCINNTSRKSIEFEGKTYFLDKKNREELIKKHYFAAITKQDDERLKLIESLKRKTDVQIPKELSDSYKFITWEQAKEMKDIITFGAHTHTHPIMPHTSKKRQELETSRKAIKHYLGYYPKSFCYPNGDYDQETIEEVRKAGFDLAFSINFGRNSEKTNPFLINRIGANINDTWEILAVKMSALSNMFKKAKAQKHLKVVMLTNYYFPQLGGITTSVHNLMKGLKHEGIKASVLAYPSLFRKIEAKSKNSKAMHRFLVMLFISYSVAYLAINKLIYGMVVAHSHSANFCVIPGVLTAPLGVKTVHTLRTDLKAGPARLKNKEYLNRADQLTSVSDHLANDYTEKFGLKKDVLTIREGTDDEDIRKMGGEDQEARKSKSINLIFVGNYLPVKDPTLFMRTIRYMREQKGWDVQARMIGDGPLRKDLEAYKYANNMDYLTLEGYKPREQVMKAIRQSDALLLTSRGEGLANVIMEAMVLGVPVISTKSGGPEEIIFDGKTGYLAKERTPEEVTKAVMKAISNRARITKEAREMIEKDYNFSKLISDYENIYLRLTMERMTHSSEENA